MGVEIRGFREGGKALAPSPEGEEDIAAEDVAERILLIDLYRAFSPS